MGVYLGSIICNAVFVIMHIVMRVKESNKKAFVFKVLASSSFFAALVSLVLLYQGHALFSSMFCIGAFFGLCGDVSLDVKRIRESEKARSSGKWLIAGFASFAVGHIAYFVGFSSLFSIALSDILLAAGISLLLTMLIIALEKPLKLRFGKYKIAILLYGFVLIFTTISCLIFTLKGGLFSGVGLRLTVAFVIFLASDLVLMPLYFTDKKGTDSYEGENLGVVTVNLLLYYLAQICIALTPHLVMLAENNLL